MLVVKLTVRARVGAAEEARAMVVIRFVSGGLVKRREAGGLYHYLTSDPDLAPTEWQRLGHDLTGREDVDMDDAGLERLLADLGRAIILQESEHSARGWAYNEQEVAMADLA